MLNFYKIFSNGHIARVTKTKKLSIDSGKFFSNDSKRIKKDMKKFNTRVTFLLTAILFIITQLGIPSQGWGVSQQEKEHTAFTLGLSEKYQPDFDHPRRYSREEMESLAGEVLEKIEAKSGAKFDRENPAHVRVLAEFFGLTPRPSLDPYSIPMTEGDISYFVEVEQHKDKELYPQDATQLVIRFYWEGLARVAARHYKLEVVNSNRSPNPQKSRGKVSDMATTAMFDKRPGISIAEAIDQGKERYDFGRLIQHLKAKGFPYFKGQT